MARAVHEKDRASYLEISIPMPVTEASMVAVFESVRSELLGSQERRVLVDLRQGQVDLSISDLHDLAKRVATLAGSLEGLALVLRPQDLLADKFFEPSVNNRGIPTLATDDADEAVYWLTTPMLARKR